MTVQALYDEYVKAKAHEVRETSLDKTKRIIKRYVLPYVQDAQIDKLSTPALQKWKTTISELDLSVVTRKNIYCEFRAMLNYAVRLEYIPKNPLVNVGNFKDAYETNVKEKLRFYTPEQFKQYITIAKSHAERGASLNDWGYYIFFMIAYYTGMRKGEINALKWSDIEGNEINVRRSIAQKLKGGDRETPPKNKSSYRTLQAPIPLVNALAYVKSLQMQDKFFTEDYRVCGGIRCLRDTSLNNKNNQFATEAKLPHIRIHDFRHSHASLLANSGINIQEVARRLGHSKIEMTWNTYSHLYPKESERALEVLNAIEI